jgi:3-deoxy-manno-octulosonate cytidylyltransferase (CMP-KDO synthetase)
VPVSSPLSLTEASVVAIIPARYESTRLPGKPLAEIAGRPMIEHVWRRASAANVHGVIVATDSERVADAVRAFGGTAWMTRADHQTGTDRLAEVAAHLPCRIIVNVQGDEPLLDPAAIDAAVEPLRRDTSLPMSTLARPLHDAAEFASPHVVKVVTDLKRRALYFSRAPVPWLREGDGAWPRVVHAGDAPLPVLGHIGLYAYRREVLLQLAGLPPTPLEQMERLEQLRALEHGIAIHVSVVDRGAAGVDTPEDLERVRQQMLAASHA